MTGNNEHQTNREILKQNHYSRCLFPLLDALGWKGDDNLIFEAIPEDPNRMDLVDLRNTMSNLRFESRAITIPLNKLDHKTLPCLYIDPDNNAKVFIKKHENEILIFDSYEDKFTHRKFKTGEGEIIYFSLTDLASDSVMGVTKNWFSKIIDRFFKNFVTVAVMSLFLSITAVISPLFVMAIFGQINAGSDIERLALLGSGISIFILATLGLKLLRSQLMGFISVRMGNIVGNQIFRRILFLPLSYTEVASVTSQLARIKDFDSIKEFYAGSAAQALFEMPFLLLLVGMMFYLGGPIGFIPLIMALVFFVLWWSMDPILKKYNVLSSKSRECHHELVMEVMENYEEIKMNIGNDSWAERHKTLLMDVAYNTFKAGQLNSLINVISYFLVSLAGLGTMAIGVHRVLAGTMGTGGLLACLLLIWRVLAPLKTAFNISAQYNKINKSIEQIDRFMTLPQESIVDTSKSFAKKIDGKIAFEGVSLRYSAEAHPALLGMSFNITPGEIVIILGHGGAGRSTIFKILLGLYTPQIGKVLIDDMNIKQLAPLLLRKSISYLPGTTHLFNGTIEENVHMVNISAVQSKLDEAIKKSGLDKELEKLEMSKDILIDHSNINTFPKSLTRKIGHARHYLKDANLFLMDEPTKDLDSEYQNTFLQYLEEVKRKKTVILITSNTKYFSVADKILWMDQGRSRMFGPADQVAEKYLEYVDGPETNSQS